MLQRQYQEEQISRLPRNTLQYYKDNTTRSNYQVYPEILCNTTKTIPRGANIQSTLKYSAILQRQYHEEQLSSLPRNTLQYYKDNTTRSNYQVYPEILCNTTKTIPRGANIQSTLKYSAILQRQYHEEQLSSLPRNTLQYYKDNTTRRKYQVYPEILCNTTKTIPRGAIIKSTPKYSAILQRQYHEEQLSSLPRNTLQYYKDNTTRSKYPVYPEIFCNTTKTIPRGAIIKSSPKYSAILQRQYHEAQISSLPRNTLQYYKDNTTRSNYQVYPEILCNTTKTIPRGAIIKSTPKYSAILQRQYHEEQISRLPRNTLQYYKDNTTRSKYPVYPEIFCNTTKTIPRGANIQSTLKYSAILQRQYHEAQISNLPRNTLQYYKDNTSRRKYQIYPEILCNTTKTIP